VRGNRLRDVAQGFVVQVEARRFSIRCNAEPQFGLAVLVEHGGQRNQSLLQFSQGLLVFSGFGFLHGVAQKSIGR
jgi:hypothetical protein